MWDVRKDFPIITNNKDLIYFDSGATTFKPKCVIDAVVNFYEFNTCNIHRGDYDMSFEVSRKYDNTRKKVAKFLNAKRSEEIIFTSGATSSLNIAILFTVLSLVLNLFHDSFSPNIEQSGTDMTFVNLLKF